MTVGSERNLFAADKRNFCRKILENVPRRKRKLGKLFCGEQGEKDAAGFFFVFCFIKEKINFSRRENKYGDKEEEAARGQGRREAGAARRQGQRECKGNDKKEGRRREVGGGGKAKGL